VLALLAAIGFLVLPIVAIVRTRKIRSLENRLAGVEAALLRVMQQESASPAAAPELPPPIPAAVAEAAPAPPEPQAPISPPPLPSAPEENVEVVIGRRWVGWIAIALIFAAAAFFLKYAFENRWIDELGRVILGIACSLVLIWAGYDRHRKGWPYLSQVLTGGGIAIIYLSIYGAFAYYHLVGQRSAFIFLAIIVAEAHLLAVGYRAPAIAIMAVTGGFLVPILLSTGRDQYVSLFTYIAILDIGTLAVVVARSWRWIGSLAWAGSQILFWAWYSEHYHPDKRVAALVFQLVIFLLFLLADMMPHLRSRPAGWEEWIRIAINPFVFYATCYAQLNDDHHAWMGSLAVLIAVVYTGVARAVMSRRTPDSSMLFVTVGTALALLTIAIPVQLESNWITICWSAEALALFWAGLKTSSAGLRAFAAIVFCLALFRFLFIDTPWISRAPFTPVLNRYFLGVLATVACLAGAAWLHWRARREGDSPRGTLAIALAAFLVLWLGSSLEAWTWFTSRAIDSSSPTAAETMREMHWGAQLALSLLWSVYAGLLTWAGFRAHMRPVRVAGLVLFGITVCKALLIDISEMRQFYRIVALLALGLILLRVAWTYQRGPRREQAP